MYKKWQFSILLKKIFIAELTPMNIQQYY